ncbi:MAG: hypothetical protein J2P19_09140, partial [Pseudonocardia sp.]|nr:hypothetical protein [Pseudonocardia sp.]
MPNDVWVQGKTGGGLSRWEERDALWEGCPLAVQCANFLVTRPSAARRQPSAGLVRPGGTGDGGKSGMTLDLGTDPNERAVIPATSERKP